jgi:hypothetical protein
MGHSRWACPSNNDESGTIDISYERRQIMRCRREQDEPTRIVDVQKGGMDMSLRNPERYTALQNANRLAVKQLSGVRDVLRSGKGDHVTIQTGKIQARAANTKKR